MAEFRVRKDESVNRTIRMKISLIDRINEVARENEVSFNALVVQMCEFALIHLPDPEGAEC
ncbi:MAG: hypothetical protein LBE35_04375 [Clostridiales bacterium]|nr:hypothetical protein [Clostridiales bacterium]